MAARKKAAAEVRPENEVDFQEPDGVDLTQDPDATQEEKTEAAPAPVVEDRPTKKSGGPVRWRLTSNTWLHDENGNAKQIPAGDIVQLTESEIEHLRKQNAIEAVL